MGNGTPAGQATAYTELLDELRIEKVYLLATSAGGSIAIRFALDFRTVRSLQYASFPVHERKDGVILDASVTNPDMARNFEDYPIENLQVPTLIFHAKDDRLASYADTEKAISRFPNCTFIPFENGGHLLTGHGEEIQTAVSEIVSNFYS